jgi:hypothetical protein
MASNRCLRTRVVLVICSPGQDTVRSIRKILLGDRMAGVSPAAGVRVSQTPWNVGCGEIE